MLVGAFVVVSKTNISESSATSTPVVTSVSSSITAPHGSVEIIDEVMSGVISVIDFHSRIPMADTGCRTYWYAVLEPRGKNMLEDESMIKIAVSHGLIISTVYDTSITAA